MVNVTPFAYPGNSNQIKLNKNGTVLISMMAATLSRTNPYISSEGSVDHVSNIHEESVVARECNPAEEMDIRSGRTNRSLEEKRTAKKEEIESIMTKLKRFKEDPLGMKKEVNQHNSNLEKVPNKEISETSIQQVFLS
eukprot:scaffold1521_cov271-Chaetoceros_neogracile.AAC.50